MPIRFERWMRSKLSAMTARTPRSIVPLAAQSREEPVPYSLPARITSGVPAALISHCGVINAHLFAAWHVHGDAALDARHQEIAQPDIGERAAHHDFMIAATRPVRN